MKKMTPREVQKRFKAGASLIDIAWDCRANKLKLHYHEVAEIEDLLRASMLRKRREAKR